MGIIKKNYKDILYFEIEGFTFDENMKHLFTTRLGWKQNNIFDDLSQVISVPKEKIYSTRQVHGTDVIIIKEQCNSDVKKVEVDGLITNIKGIALSTYHADCVPIYFYDKVNKVIGMAHAGWKGTLNNIAQVMVNNMVKDFSSRLKDIHVALGPSIGVCCYEIGEEVAILFKERYPYNSHILVEKDNKIYLDLWNVNMVNLLNAGIRKENIYLSDYCTSCNTDTVFSYRKEKGTTNRMLAVISLSQ